MQRLGFGCRRHEALGVWLRLAVAALVLTGALAVPLRFSADAWAYAAYGALIAHGIDPWAHAYGQAQIAPLADPLLDRALAAWQGSLPRDVYGPLFSLPCAALVIALRGAGPAATVFALRMLAAGALLACIGLAGRSRPRLATLLAVHPVVLWAAAEGHNDVFWLALVLAGDRIKAGSLRTALLTAGALVKAVAAVPLAAAVARGGQRGWTAAVVTMTLAAGYAPLAWSLIAHGLDHAPGPPRLSLLHAPALAAWSGSAIPLVTAALLAGVGAAAVSRAWRSGDRLAAAALLGWLLLPAPEPWYAVWFLPVVAMVRRSPAATGLMAATFCGAAGYVQDAVSGTALHNPALVGGTMLALYALPLLLAALGQVPQPQPQPQPVPPTPPPLTSPVPSPVATTSPIPAGTATPLPPMTPSPVPSPTLFGYVVDPPLDANATPRIVEIAINDRTLHQGQILLVKITTSTDVTALIARTMGHQIGIPIMSPGVFAGQQQLPSGIPSFLLNRNYQIEFVATTADGKTTVFAVPLRLER